jgi:hypothetical protein
MTDDLSDYERVRLENIKRNAEFLAGLGLQDVLPKKNKVDKELAQVAAGKRKRSDDEARRTKEQQQSAIPTRRSLRVQQIQEGVKLKEEELELAGSLITESEPTKRSYADLPFDSDELDDFEFQVFVSLKKWRLLRSRELDLEPYKICQNRTLAELVRRRRNDSSWASAEKSEKDKSKDLLECWGIGPSKASKDGYGDLLIQEIDKSESLLEYLVKSRLNGDEFPEDANDK